MRVMLFGATGMIGQGTLLECLDDDGVGAVVALGRRPTGREHTKLRELTHGDFTQYALVEDQLGGFDACLYCLGISSAGLGEADYTRITYDYTLAAAEVLLRHNPRIVFCYVSGQGTDSSEQGRTMWARVKGRTENALLKMPFRAAYMFQPGYIQPLRGVASSTPAYRYFYAGLGWIYPALKGLFPAAVSDSARLGRAMIAAVREGGPSRVVGVGEINRLGAR